ncbi:MAG: hypothetical protein Q8P10_00300 [bacterium]|nr:hypothetical protein [bacterium]
MVLSKETVNFNPGLEIEEKFPNIGVGFVVLRVDPSKNGENSRDPYIWTIEELCDKPATGRRKGDISIPLETRELNEFHVQTLRRGLFEEFVGKDDLPRFAPNLFFGLRHKDINLEVKGRRNVACDVDIVVYDGLRREVPIPSSTSEVKPHGWMPLFGEGGVLKLTNLRPIAKQVLDQVVKNNSIAQALANYEKARSLSGGRPIFYKS